MIPFLDSKTKPMRRGRSQSTGFISLIEDTAGRSSTNKNDTCRTIRTQNTLDRLNLILVTAGGERADHVVF